MKKVTVIGGGHGLSTILKGIRNIEDIDISAVVTVADDGGSTGRIRKRYGIPAVGDIRNVLLSLSDADPLLKELMDYRFEGNDDTDVSGHSLGNLILAALTDISSSFDKAIGITSNLLNVKGKIIPSTLENVTLYAVMDDDTIVKGEANIPSMTHEITKVFYRDEVDANPEAIKAIMEADLIIYGIGSLYTSILSNTIIRGISKALNETKARKVYFANCMTQSNETYNYDLDDHLKALESHGTKVDTIITHSNIIPEEIRKRYAAQDSIEVVNHHGFDAEVLSEDLLVFDDGLVRHDPEKIKKVIERIL